MTALHPEFGPIAILACISLLLPLPWHWRARNIATLSIIFWFFIMNLIYAVDAFVWRDNVDIVIPVWCDISTKLIIGASYALPASCLCISMYLERIASLRMAQHSALEKKRRQWFEAFMGFGLPVIFMGLHFIVQGHRYDIIQGYGCRPTTYYSIAAIFIVWVPPLLLAFGSVVYSALALRHFVIRRLTFAAHLQASKTALTTSRYLRLMAMAAIQMVSSITISSYALYFTSLALPLRPWTTWDKVHSDFRRVDQYPVFLIPPTVLKMYTVSWWFTPVSTFIFVAFFAFGRDALEEYSKLISWVRTKVFRRSDFLGKSKPVFSFVNLQSSKAAPQLPISKPVLQSMTSSDYTLPPYESTTRVSLSSLHKTITTLNDPESDGTHEYDYRLRDSSTFSQSHLTSTSSTPTTIYGFRHPKAIGSYSDLSIVSPSLSTATIVPSEPSLGHKYSAKTSFSTPIPTPPAPLPTTLASRLRPLLLGRAQGTDEGPIAYRSYDAERWGSQEPHGQP